ncbi:hypothetical protein ACIOMM_05210 [Streptomyces sp. NPDC087908]|uniref:hypothetical protein n=1 Tax=unclassified Streptomyces TaxID=2593676 RepID=UPI0011CDAC3B|nr:hypothetical protein [Streptomyces sp. adm13(2018)]TXS08273.1 hypothetical protein EAO70_34815 [Streptomyces sp. adm13(2018)]
MGVYMVSLCAEDWFGADEDGWGEVASALDTELVRRGLSPYKDAPPETRFQRGSGLRFEEKLAPPMTGFTALGERHLSPEEWEILCGWSVLVPVSLDEEIWMPIESADFHSMIAGAPQVLVIAEKLAAAIALPPEVPATCDNLDLSTWFGRHAAKVAGARPGPWSEDLDAAFYVALFLRAAQHSIRRGCPMICR